MPDNPKFILPTLDDNDNEISIDLSDFYMKKELTECDEKFLGDTLNE